MALTLHKKFAATYEKKKTAVSPWKRFINWADSQEEHRFGWTAFAITAHGCAFTIFTIVMILLAGNPFILWPFAIGAMAVCLITNLSALPTKITIPVLFFSILVDVVIVAICIARGLSFANIYN
jgi:hypothetical protein